MDIRGIKNEKEAAEALRFNLKNYNFKMISDGGSVLFVNRVGDKVEDVAIWFRFDSILTIF